MRFSAILPAAMATLAVAMPQAALKPSESAPAGCSASYTGNFGLTVVELGKRSLDKRSSCTGAGSLDLLLKDGILTDSKGRIGSIVANYQFQFDGPPAQAGAIYTSGFSVCSNGSLALGGSTTFYRCLSGDFYNLYDRHWAEQCSPIHLSALACGADAPVPSGSVVGTTMVVTTVVTVIGDGQPQVVPTTIPVPLCQIGDGQVQGHTTPCGELPPVTVTPSAPASQPPYTPPGTPVAPPATTAPVVPPVPTSQVPVSVPSVPSTPVNSTAVVTTPATTATPPATTTTPAAPPVAAGQNLAPASFVALVATLMAVVCLI